MWHAPRLLQLLHTIIDRSNIRAVIDRERERGAGATATGDEASAPSNTYKMLGYFSIVGLVRMHSLLGDYYSTLQVLGNIDVSRKGVHTRVPACHISLSYYVGFAYMMVRRYLDAIRTFSNILLYISRTERFHSRSYQHEQMMKRNEQMYALLAMTLSLCPQRVDESLHVVLREKYGDKSMRMQRGYAKSLGVGGWVVITGACLMGGLFISLLSL